MSYGSDRSDVYSAYITASNMGNFAAFSPPEADTNFGVEVHATAQDLRRPAECELSSSNAETSCVPLKCLDVCLQG